MPLVTVALSQIPEEEWPTAARQRARRPCEVWRSTAFLVSVYRERESDYVRLSVNRVTRDRHGQWEEGITWEDLQRLKRECGRADRWAVEVYPPDEDIVNVANMRHLWLLPEPPPYGWREEQP